MSFRPARALLAAAAVAAIVGLSPSTAGAYSLPVTINVGGCIFTRQSVKTATQSIAETHENNSVCGSPGVRLWDANRLTTSWYEGGTSPGAVVYRATPNSWLGGQHRSCSTCGVYAS